MFDWFFYNSNAGDIMNYKCIEGDFEILHIIESQLVKGNWVMNEIDSHIEIYGHSGMIESE